MSRPQLRALARACGILDDYRATDGLRRFVSDMTCEALLDAMGLDASSEHTAAESFRDLQERQQKRIFDAASLSRSGVTARGGIEQVKRKGAKVSRNAPCPCGSGKKYKRCCGAAG